MAMDSQKTRAVSRTRRAAIAGSGAARIPAFAHTRAEIAGQLTKQNLAAFGPRSDRCFNPSAIFNSQALVSLSRKHQAP